MTLYDSEHQVLLSIALLILLFIVLDTYFPKIIKHDGWAHHDLVTPMHICDYSVSFDDTLNVCSVLSSCANIKSAGFL